jgi:hypothetical protein
LQTTQITDLKECHANADESAKRQMFSWDGTVYDLEKGKEKLNNFKQGVRTEQYQKCETEKHNCQNQCSSNTTPHCCGPTQKIKVPN